MQKAGQGCAGCLVLLVIGLVVLVIVGAVAGDAESGTSPVSTESRPTQSPRAAAQVIAATTSAVPTPAATMPTVTAAAAPATPESTPAAKATPAPTRTPRPTRTPSPQITYAACDDVPTHLLRLDTQGRVAVERALVPSQPDGDSDGFACGDQLEHKRSWVASLTPAPSASVQATTTPRTPTAKTAQAAPTSVECLTPSEAAYLVAYGEQLLVIASTFEEMQPLFDDPRVFFDTDAQVVFVVGAALVQAAAQNIIDLEPPASRRIQAIDAAAVRMAQRFISSMDTLAQGIDSLDADLITRATRLLEDANADMNDITTVVAQINELCR